MINKTLVEKVEKVDNRKNIFLRLPESAIDEIKNRIDIVDVVGDFVSLKRSGQNFKALSPFTNERTPSFYVVPSKGIFKDFSSGKGGDAIKFVMEHEGVNYIDAMNYLAEKYGVFNSEKEKLSKGQQIGKSSAKAQKSLLYA